VKRPELILAGLAVALVTFVVVQARSVPPRRAATAAVPAADSQSAESTVAAEPAAASVSRDMRLTSGAPRRDLDDIRRRIALDSPGTYIGEVIRDADSVLVRWDGRDTDPLRIWIQYGAGVPGWKDDFVRQATEAFGDWTATGVPVRFSFVVDSASSDVPLVWIDRFGKDARVGNTHISGLNGVIDHAAITVALHTQQGFALRSDMIKATVAHEVGHLLGLPHTTDTTSIMVPYARIRPLSESDRRTVLLLYALPTGSIR
jgi:hypothetical protein